MAVYQAHELGRSSLVHCELMHVESVSVGLWFRTGSRYEPVELHGGAHFLEHMLFKGTRRRNALQISEAVESRGGDLNAFTSEEMTCYYCRVDANHLKLVLDVLFDMLWHSSFPAEEMSRERGVIQEEIRMYEDQPQVVVQERLNQAMWPSSTLGRSILGSSDSVAGLSRTRLMKFWRGHYGPDSLVVSVAGRVGLEEVQSLLMPHLHVARTAPDETPWHPVSFKTRRRPLAVALTRPVQQCNLAVGIHGLQRKDPRRYAEKLLSVILGENMSSRLFQILREKHGLAYSINTAISHFNDTGAFYIQAGVDRENVSAALKLIAKELERIARYAPSAAELRRAKDYTIGQMKLGLESTTNRMMWMGECMIGLGHLVQPGEVIGIIESVSPEQVRQLAAHLFQPGRVTVAGVGPDLDESAMDEAADAFNVLG
jgi:predicted Zn-dependent peptidase